MKIGVFGGSFNPIHNSHLYLARQFAAALKLDKVLLIPTYIPPHKGTGQMAPSEDRLVMCRLAVEGDPLFEVSDMEIRRGDKSYTWMTLEELRRRSPGDDLYLIMGADMFLSILDWKNPLRIFRLATLCAAAREAGEYQKLTEQADKLASFGAKSLVLDIPPLPLASTQVRREVASGQRAEESLPPQVAEYIRDRGLYRGEEP